MLIALCLVTFVLGWALSSYYIEQKQEEEELRRTKRLSKKIAEEARKEEYLDYVWRNYD